MEKIQELDKLYNEYKSIFGEEDVVLGDGNVNARLILIGEAPGKDEVRLSKPFVGAAGKNLTDFLGIIGIERDNIYITNVIKYRLSKQNVKTGRISNRPATKDEISQSRSYLLDEISVINPEIIVTLGNVPLRAVTGDYSLSIGSVHGQVHKITIIGIEYNLFPLYHPASIIYNRSLKDVYGEDVLRLPLLLK